MGEEKTTQLFIEVLRQKGVINDTVAGCKKKLDRYIEELKGEYKNQPLYKQLEFLEDYILQYSEEIKSVYFKYGIAYGEDL